MGLQNSVSAIKKRVNRGTPGGRGSVSEPLVTIAATCNAVTGRTAGLDGVVDTFFPFKFSFQVFLSSFSLAQSLVWAARPSSTFMLRYCQAFYPLLFAKPL